METQKLWDEHVQWMTLGSAAIKSKDKLSLVLR